MAVDFDTLVNVPCVATFGETFTYTPAGGAPFNVNGVFDAAWSDASFTVNRHGQAVSTTKPRLGVRATDCPVPPEQGDTLVQNKTGDTFTVADVQPDGFGYLYLVLN